MSDQHPSPRSDGLFRRLVPRVARRAFKRILYRDYIHCFWHKDGTNWGDALNPILVEMLSGRKARFCSDPDIDKFLVIGSILESADSNTTVWGAGFIQANQRMHSFPRSICAVRGPLSRAELLKGGIEVPEVYGDPALLLPMFYCPPAFPEYEIGIVVHYADKGCDLCRRYGDDPSVLIIDVESETFSFIDMIRNCRMVVSSSLHGIICSDAYGIPNVWIEVSDRVIGSGFKFRDYYASVSRKVDTPVSASAMSLARIVDCCTHEAIDIDLDLLLSACPFAIPAATS